MVEPKCPECGKSNFSFREVKRDNNVGPDNHAYIIYCTQCGEIVGSGGNYFRW